MLYIKIEFIWKGKIKICKIMLSISKKYLYILRTEIFSLETSHMFYMLIVNRQKFLTAILSVFCGFISDYTFCLQEG